MPGRAACFSRCKAISSRANVRVAFSPDGTRLASAGLVPNVKIWETGTWQELLSLNGHERHVRCLSFSHDNRYLASGGMTRRSASGTQPRGRRCFISPARRIAVTCVTFSPDGKRLFSCGEGSINVWDLQNRVKLLTLHERVDLSRSALMACVLLPAVAQGACRSGRPNCSVAKNAGSDTRNEYRSGNRRSRKAQARSRIKTVGETANKSGR